jgi:LysM repeat protein
MTKKDEKLDQAEELRKKMDTSLEEQDSSTDVLDLPPRSEKHVQEEKKTKWKVKHPVVRLLGICFILIPGTIVAYIIHKQNSEVASPNHYDRVTINEEAHTAPKKEEPKKQEPKQEESKKEEAKEGDESKTEEASAPKQQPIEKKDDMIYHTVQEGDTLYKLSMKYYGNRNGERAIQEYNELTSNDLVVGSVLQFPKNLDAIAK